MSSSSTDGAPPLLEVGRIDKPHGLRGEVVVRLTTNVESRLAPGVTLQTDRGALRVVASRPHQQRWVVQFDGIVDREQAETWRGMTLRAEPLPADAVEPDVLWVHDLVGRVVVETDGTERGTVESVQDNPAADLLVLDSGALVPLTFVVRLEEPRRVVVEVPEGLFDL